MEPTEHCVRTTGPATVQDSHCWWPVWHGNRWMSICGVKSSELLPSQILPPPAPQGWDSTLGGGGRQSMSFSRIICLFLPFLQQSKSGNRSSESRWWGFLRAEDQQDVWWRARGQEPRGPGVSENPPETAAQGVRAGWAWTAQEEGGDTEGQMGDGCSHRHWGGRTLGLKSKSLGSNFYLSLNWISDLWARGGILSFSQGKCVSQVADVKSLWESTRGSLWHGT